MPGSWVRGSTREHRSVGRTIRIRANASVAPVALGPGVVGRVARAIEGADVVHVHEPLMPLVSLTASVARRRSSRHSTPTLPGGVRAVYAAAGRSAAASPEERRHHRGVAHGRRSAADLMGTCRDHPQRRSTWPVMRPAPPASPGRVTFLGRDDPRKGLDVASGGMA
jgi:phosphatidyl-myo-inositol alpha-mannosyltransferase